MLGTLYIVATPIGNLEDITLRALRILKEVDTIYAEDTRVTSKLLSHYDIDKHILSYHHHSPDSVKQKILTELVMGKNCALVTDAGTPGISDPGNELIEYLLIAEPELKVVPIPGASALTSALSVSGFNTSKFVFLGFLPKKKRTKIFKWLKDGGVPFGFYESPHRVVKSLTVIGDFFGPSVRVCIARELTKMYETVYRGDISGVANRLSKEKVRGEIVVVVEL